MDYNYLTSFNFYPSSSNSPVYHIRLGKITSQELHWWYHGPSSTYNNDSNINQSNNNSNNSGPVFGNNKINNPFAAAQFKKQPKPPQLNQKKNMNNLHNRYAVGYNK